MNHSAEDAAPRICVFAPNLLVTVTIESGPRGDEVHLHAGGQGYWVARAIHAMGEHPVLCAPVGGEAGAVLQVLVEAAGFELAGVKVRSDSPAYVHDRRHGERRELATTEAAGMSRHELDELYGVTFARAMACGLAVLTGTAAGWKLPRHFLHRLSSDLVSTGVATIADLHGEDLSAVLEGGSIDVLKVSDDDLAQDKGNDVPPGADEDSLFEAVLGLNCSGATDVVVSRASGATIGYLDGRFYRTTGPELEAMDHRGSGDTMTAALAVARGRGENAAETLRMAAAAGAANVTRHGLGAPEVELIEELKRLTEAGPISGDPGPTPDQAGPVP